ncbi:hypothetical protein ACFZAU_17680 [Streptomyces sp. NPDC008238]
MEAVNGVRARRERRFPGLGRRSVKSWEHTMDDLAFLLVTLAVFALIALIAKGVAKL